MMLLIFMAEGPLSVLVLGRSGRGNERHDSWMLELFSTFVKISMEYGGCAIPSGR